MQLSKELSDSLIPTIEILREINVTENSLKKDFDLQMLKDESPNLALKLFDSYKNQHLSLDPELVWEYSALGNHYQIMLFDNNETITVSLCPNRFVPWAVRNAVHPREADFVVVNGLVLKIMDVMEIIDEYLENDAVRKAIINQAILKHQLAKMDELNRNIYDPTKEQMQVAFDRWRTVRGLQNIAAYNQYLASIGLTHQSLERKIRHIQWSHNFFDAQSQISVKDYFLVNIQDFGRYKLESYIAGSEQEAIELTEYLKNQPGNLSTWARDVFLKDNNDIKTSTYQLNTCFHYQLDTQIMNLLKSSSPTGWLPQLKINGKSNFVNIISYYPPKLDEETELIARQRLISKFISEKKESSNIQWLWGDTDIFRNYNIQE